VLQIIYQQDVVGFSDGSGLGRSGHDALVALVAITSKKVNWILDVEIEGFFDALDHDWLIKFLQHRIGEIACTDPLAKRAAGCGELFKAG